MIYTLLVRSKGVHYFLISFFHLTWFYLPLTIHIVIDIIIFVKDIIHFLLNLFIFLSYFIINLDKLLTGVKDMPKVLKNNLRLLMAKKGIRTMVELEEKSGVSRQVLDRFEKNKSKRLDFETITKLCEFFECEVGDLLYLEDVEEED
jgi:putative transcriptional regulator